MNLLARRNFLSAISSSLAGTLIPTQFVKAESRGASTGASTGAGCWLEVAAPFIVEDAEAGIDCEIVLTSDTFAGVNGHVDGRDSSDYEIYLYDAAGRAIGEGGVARRMTVPAMRTTVVSVRELIGDAKKFFGGMKIRLRPAERGSEQQLPHASDLFSSAFVRWRTAGSFDNVHANPDPLQWQNTDSYYYSMPFPPLDRHECVFSLFNPNNERSAGEITVYDSMGKRLAGQRYELKPHASLLFDLNSGSIINEPWARTKPGKPSGQKGNGGLLTVVNDLGTAKSFGYLMIRRGDQKRFSVEHPIHQSVFKQKPAASPFDASQFRAKNVLYSPLLFRGKKFNGPAGELTFDSQFYFGAGLPLEESLWLYPFAVDGQGEVVWSAIEDKRLAAVLPSQTERGVIRLAANQSCTLDFDKLSAVEKNPAGRLAHSTGHHPANVPHNFSGGLAVAVSPDTNHTLFKVEVRIREWDAYAFTHFRPGLRSARWYQKPKPRGGLATDYIVSGARVVKSQQAIQFNELIGVINIDDQDVEARPTLELFGNKGLVARVPLGAIPPFGCRHFLLSDLIEGDVSYDMLSLRLVDERATLLMSAVHLDYQRLDIALDHGSDRFSTFLDFVCR